MENKKSSAINKLSRRDFIRNISLTAAGTIAAGCLTDNAGADNSSPTSKETAKILNYNPQMGYRKLGKTGLILSEVSLGGHFKNRKGERYWKVLKNDEVPGDIAKNRIDVISLCIDLGINYVDLGSSGECLIYGVALKGRRDKMFVGADDFMLCPRSPKRCTVKKLTFDIDECLRRLGMDYLDIWRMKADMEGKNTDQHVETMIEAFQKAHKAGKARFLGISSHRRPWLQHVVENFPEVQVVSFPCTARTKEKGKQPVLSNIKEVNAGFGADTDQSIFQVVREKNVGVITIKPFMGGSLF
ncbi:MAG: aldo/keto reductase, partial [Planctomycetota bacterium]